MSDGSTARKGSSAARRRSDALLTAQKVFDASLYEPLQLPGKTLRLERDSLLDYRHRPSSAQVSVTELCHENTKLWPRRIGELACTLLDAPAFASEYVQRRAHAFALRGSPPVSVNWRIRSVLGALPRAAPPPLFYAVELRVCEGESVLLYEPVSGKLELIKEMTPRARVALERAVQLTGNVRRLGSYIVLVGSFARNEILFGVRGHRRTILDVGQVCQALLSAGGNVGVPIEPIYEFTDRDVDGVVEVDGTEAASLVVLYLEGDTHVSQG